MLKRQSSFKQGKPGLCKKTFVSSADMAQDQLDMGHRAQSPATQSSFRSTAQRDRIRQESSENESVNAPEPQAGSTRGRGRGRNNAINGRAPADNRNRNRHRNVSDKLFNATIFFNILNLLVSDSRLFLSRYYCS